MVKYFAVPKELKAGETRVSLTPDVIGMLPKEERGVLVEKDAGLLAGFTNEEYEKAGAEIVSTPEELWSRATYILKIKEPQVEEYKFFNSKHVLLGYLHLDTEKQLAEELLKKKVCSVSLERIHTKNGDRPILSPMSQVAGRIAIQAGAKFLERTMGGSGILLGGVPGVSAGKVVIIGGGTVGLNAARVAHGMGADVSVLDVNHKKLAKIDLAFNGGVKTFYSNPMTIAREASDADILIGAVYVQGKMPKLVTADVVKQMKKGSVVMDVAIDQGGVIETIDRITTHENPVYEKYGVLHYAVPNVPSTVPKTASLAFSYAMFPYLHQICEEGIISAIKKNEVLATGVSTFNGMTTSEKLADILGKEHTELSMIVGF